MRIRINSKNCRLYVGDICRCVRYEEGDHLTIKSSKLIDQNVLLLSVDDYKYLTINDFMRRRGRILGTGADKKGDVFVSTATLREPSKEEYNQLSLRLKRN